jgi:RNA polymerase sigma factor (sigma-70 family)
MYLPATPAPKHMPLAECNRLCEENVGLAYHCADHWLARTSATFVTFLGGPDEVKAACLYFLVHAARYFDPARGWKFSTYACNIIFRNLARLHKQEGPKMPGGSVDFEGVARDQNGALAVEDDGPRRVELRDELARLRRHVARLSDADRELLTARFFAGRTYRDLAAESGVSRSSVQNHERAALARLAASMGNPDLLLSLQAKADREAERRACA